MPAVPNAPMGSLLLSLLLAAVAPALAQPAPIKAAHTKIAAPPSAPSWRQSRRILLTFPAQSLRSTPR
jgi:hypothetical protein